MSFDITDFSGLNTGQISRDPKPSQPTQQQNFKPKSAEVGGEVAKLAKEFDSVPSLTKKEREMDQRRKEELPGAWSIDKAMDDGQIFAGEVDKEQAAFLENTTFVD